MISLMLMQVFFTTSTGEKTVSNEAITAIIDIESGGQKNPNTCLGDNGDSVGIVQIQKRRVDYINDYIFKYKKYSYADRKCPVKSVEMLRAFIDFYRKNNPTCSNVICLRQWNKARPNKDYEMKLKNRGVK